MAPRQPRRPLNRCVFRSWNANTVLPAHARIDGRKRLSFPRGLAAWRLNLPCVLEWHTCRFLGDVDALCEFALEFRFHFAVGRG